MQVWHKQVQISPQTAGLTLREQLTRLLIPRRIQGQLRQKRRVLVNDTYQNMQTILKTGDIIAMTFVESDFLTPVSQYVPDHQRAIEVLWENDDVVVVDKPSGIKTHPNSPGEVGTLMNFVQAYLEKEEAAAYMVHRLDEATSGAILVAKNPIAVSILNAQLKTKSVTRHYIALLEGVMPDLQGNVSLPIGIDETAPRLRKVSGLNAQAAKTHWRVVQTNGAQTLVQLILETGRTHQIRVHMQAMGHPIVGDDYYNPTSQAPRLMLHAQEIRFIPPFSDQVAIVAEPIPTGFFELFKRS